MPKRIMLVDDSPILQAAVVEALTRAGFEVAVRGTFDELLEHGVAGYDLILMDVHMPELFGDDVAAVLRHERGIATPIYLYSSLAPEELAERAQAARVDGFISKDISMRALVTRVREILAA